MSEFMLNIKSKNNSAGSDINHVISDLNSHFLF